MLFVFQLRSSVKGTGNDSCCQPTLTLSQIMSTAVFLWWILFLALVATVLHCITLTPLLISAVMSQSLTTPEEAFRKLFLYFESGCNYLPEALCNTTVDPCWCKKVKEIIYWREKPITENFFFILEFSQYFEPVLILNWCTFKAVKDTTWLSLACPLPHLTLWSWSLNASLISWLVFPISFISFSHPFFLSFFPAFERSEIGIPHFWHLLTWPSVTLSPQ